MNDLFHRLGPVIGCCVLGISAFWVVLMVVLPQVMMVDMSLRPNLPPSLRGGGRGP